MRAAIIALTLALLVLGLAGCQFLPPEISGMLGGGPSSTCKHENMVHIEYKPATCTDFGQYECYGCTDCNRLFLDEAATKETSQEAMILLPLGGEHEYADGNCKKCGQCEHLARENCFCNACNEVVHNLEFIYGTHPTCEEDGINSHYLCLDCGKAFFDDKNVSAPMLPEEIVVPAYQHRYDTFINDGICKICGLYDESKIVCKHTNFTSDCICLLCGEAVHMISFYETTPATCKFDGRNEHYRCVNCHRFFRDEEGSDEITTRDELIIPKIGGEHSFVDGICGRCGLDSELPRPSLPYDPTAELFEGHPTLCMHQKLRIADEYIAPTCTGFGYMETFYCESCYRLYLDSEGTNEIPHDYDTSIPALGHNFVEGECQGCGRIDMSTIVCTEHPNVENCTCTRCFKTVHTINPDEVIHASPVTCTDYGYTADVYFCTECERGFYDAEGRMEISYDEVVIYPLGHDYLNNACQRCGHIPNEENQYIRPSDPTVYDLAIEYLIAIYAPDNKTATPSDYKLASYVVIDGVKIRVTWTIANKSITISQDEASYFCNVDVPEEVNESCYYSVIAVICNADGLAQSYTFVRLLEATI